MHIGVVDKLAYFVGILGQIAERYGTLVKGPKQFCSSSTTAIPGKEKNVLELIQARSREHPKNRVRFVRQSVSNGPHESVRSGMHPYYLH